MPVTLTHPFKDKLPDIDEFFQLEDRTGTINTINSFCYKVKKLAEKYSISIDPNKFKGDALELLVEFLIKENAGDNRIGIYDYIPITGSEEEDTGVDGSGIGENQNPATVQVKFRAGDYILTANEDHLSNFLTSSVFDFNVHIEDMKNMLIITTGLKVDDHTKEKMLKGKVRVLNRDALREMLDSRPEWWARFYDAVKASRIETTTFKAECIPLRKHQTEAIEAISKDENMKGKIILPTGTGKTLIEAKIILETIRNLQSKDILPIIKVNSSRILLCFQLFEEVYKYLNSSGISARYVNFNSGNQDDNAYAIEVRKMGGIFREILSTTSPNEAKELYAKACLEKLPMIIFSTYHSSEKFASSGLVPHLTIHDEAHNLVSKEFYKAASLTNTGNLFFTATEKITDSEDDLGMNNPAIFDNMIYTRSPKEMIDAGEMVSPRIHVVKSKNGATVDLNKLDRDYDALFLSIRDAFFAHQRRIREESFDPSQLGAKVLVVCRGQQDLMEMFNTKIFEKFKTEYPDIHLFALSSEFGLYNDGEMISSPVNYVKKFSFLKKVKALAPSDKAIIFHVDMIGEGIDVSGITGVMPFRNCELAKFVQNIGRSSRLHPIDRKRFYANEISVEDKTQWIKPYSWVIVPSFLENSEGFKGRAIEIVETLRSQYGYIPQQQTIIDNVKGLADEEEIDTVNEKVKNRPHANSGLNEFEHELEELSMFEKIIFDEKVDEEKGKIESELDNLMAGV